MIIAIIAMTHAHFEFTFLPACYLTVVYGKSFCFHCDDFYPSAIDHFHCCVSREDAQWIRLRNGNVMGDSLRKHFSNF